MMNLAQIWIRSSPKMGNFISNAATDALQNTVEGFIPFRGWLRS